MCLLLSATSYTVAAQEQVVPPVTGSPDATPAQSATPNIVRSVEAPLKERRHHFVARDHAGNVYFEGTEIVNMSGTVFENNVLLRDHSLGRGVHFRSFSDYESKEVIYSLTEAAGGSFLRVEFSLPYNAKTFSGVSKEARENPAAYEVAEAHVTFVTNSVRRTILESALTDRAVTWSLRSELRASLSPGLLETLERLREGMLGSSAVSGFHHILLTHLYWGMPPPEGQASTDALEVVPAPPDCRYDADMGKPCNERQLRKIAEAAKEGKILAAY